MSNTCELLSDRNTTDNDGQQVLQYKIIIYTREGQKTADQDTYQCWPGLGEGAREKGT